MLKYTENIILKGKYVTWGKFGNMRHIIKFKKQILYSMTSIELHSNLENKTSVQLDFHLF